MKKLTSFLAILCVLNVLVITGLVLFLIGTGRLDKEKAQTISDLLKHTGSPEKLRERVYDLIDPVAVAASATAPATLPGFARHDEPEPATAEERINYMRRALEEERLALESERQDLRNQQETLLKIQRNAEAELKTLAAHKLAFEQQQAAVGAKSDDEGFKKTMAMFDELKPKQIKDLIGKMPPESIARYLNAMEPDRAAKIIGEFKSETERVTINQVLDKIRGAAPVSGTGAASGTPPAAPTAVSAAGAASRSGP